MRPRISVGVLGVLLATYTQVLDSFDWWREELRAAWASLAPKTKQPKPSDITIGIADDGIRVQMAGAPEFQSPPLYLNATSDEIAALLRSGRRHPSIAIRIDSALILKRQLGPQRLPARQARTMAELDLMASTPIDPSQVHLVFDASFGEGCCYHVVKTKALSAVLDAVRAVGGTIQSLSILEEGRAKPADRLSLAAIWPPARRERLARRAWITACVVLFLGLAATYTHAQWRYWQAGSDLDGQIELVQAQAKKARSLLQKRQTEIEQTERIRNERSKAVSTVHVLAELTRLLPDSAWLTDLSSKKDQLTITGYAASAADLIQPINASPLFSSPEFAAPVVKVPGQTGERFTITARIEAR